MKVQTLSIVIPTQGCVNNCAFCCSKIHNTSKQIQKNEETYLSNVLTRLKYAQSLGVNTIIYTGTGEVLQNRTDLKSINNLLIHLNNPFPNIELQTSGVLLKNNIDQILDNNINTVSLSVSDLFDDDNNMKIIGVSPKLHFALDEICKLLLEHDINIRLSINLVGEEHNIKDYFERANELGASQITFRQMYSSNIHSEIDEWIEENKLPAEYLTKINEYIITNSSGPIYRLPFGADVYSVKGISTVIDNNCMAKTKDNSDLEKLKYFILRENGKLYCRWDDKGSLIF